MDFPEREQDGRGEASVWGESGPKEAGLSVVTVTCRDEKMQMTYLQHESWLRPLLRSNQVEHCWCNGGRAQCHSVPVRSTCPPKAGVGLGPIPTAPRPEPCLSQSPAHPTL